MLARQNSRRTWPLHGMWGSTCNVIWRAFRSGRRLQPALGHVREIGDVVSPHGFADAPEHLPGAGWVRQSSIIENADTQDGPIGCDGAAIRHSFAVFAHYAQAALGSRRHRVEINHELHYRDFASCRKPRSRPRRGLRKQIDQICLRRNTAFLIEFVLSIEASRLVPH